MLGCRSGDSSLHTVGAISSAVAPHLSSSDDAALRDELCQVPDAQDSENVDAIAPLPSNGQSRHDALVELDAEVALMRLSSTGPQETAALANGTEGIKAVVVWGIEEVVVGMGRQLSSARVQEQGCKTLGDLAENAEQGGAVAAKGGIEAVVAAMQD